ncbi:MAG: hypothetical protein ACXVCP_18000 [Bdellovibrio sp.]
MKYFFILISLFCFQSAYACLDISGKYLIGSKFFIQYRQNKCEQVTESWCSADGRDCGGSSYTWTLDGQMIQYGGNPSKWASVLPEGNSLHRMQLCDSGTTHGGHQCWWKELWYKKEQNGNLRVTFKLSCSIRGQEKIEFEDQIWEIAH